MIGRALRAQLRGMPFDLPLAGAALAALLLALSIALNVPPELASTPAAARGAVHDALGAVTAVYAATMAAVYGSFRFTIDLRDGVVARRATIQHRGAGLIARLPVTALGGAVVATAAMTGAGIATAIALGDVVIPSRTVVATLVVGAVAALWGLAIGLVVRAHLTSLFVAPLSLGIAMVVASQGWDATAVWMPLPVLVRAAGLDLSALGIDAATQLDPAVAVLVCTGWVGAAIAAGAASFILRDVD